MNQVLRWFLVVLALLLTVEITLRLVGVAVSLPQSRRNAVAPADRDAIRILTIGESTTVSDAWSI